MLTLGQCFEVAYEQHMALMEIKKSQQVSKGAIFCHQIYMTLHLKYFSRFHPYTQPMYGQKYVLVMLQASYY